MKINRRNLIFYPYSIVFSVRFTYSTIFYQVKAFIYLFVAFFVSKGSTNLFGHGDLDLRIESATEEIKNTPDSAFLYFKRGKLYFQHEEYSKSIQDIDSANHLGYSDKYASMIKSQCLLRLDSFQKALNCILPIQLENPELTLPYKILGSIYFEMGSYEASALSWQDAILHSKRKIPEDYINASNSWFQLNNHENYAKGIYILNEGLVHFSNIHSLLIHKRDSALKFSDFETAIAVQNTIIDQSKRKEIPYFELGEIFEKARMYELALEHYIKSKNAVEKLPSHIRSNKSMRILEDSLFQKINQEKN